MTAPFRIIVRDAAGAILPGAAVALDPLPAAGRRRWRLRVAGPLRGSVELRAELPAAECPWFLLPGFFYGQGRREARLRYPGLRTPGAPDDEFIQPAWTFAADRSSHPLVLLRHQGTWHGFDAGPHWTLRGAAGTPSQWGDGEPQVGFGLGWAEGLAHVSVHVPAQEGPRRHVRQPRHGPLARTFDLPTGSELTLEVGLWAQPGDAHGWYGILDHVYRELRPAHPRAELDDPRELGAAAAHGLTAWHWIEPAGDGRPGYFVYTVPMDRSVEFNANVNRSTSLGWHFEALGFVGGFAVAHALHWWGRRLDDARAVTIARQAAERWCRDGVSPSGLFRTSYHPGRARTRHGEFANGGDTPGYGSCWQGDPAIAHARTTADASFYLARLLAQDAQAMPAAWRDALRGSLEAALRLQRADGRHAQRYDALAGTVRDWEGDGGLLWIAAMDAAHGLFADDPAFQRRLERSMQAAGEAYAGAVEAERICGAPEDVSLAPTSEDGYNAVMAYARLHRRFGDAAALALWRRAAEWTCSWRRAWNSRWDARSLLGATGFRCVGGDYASSNNNHLHLYGLNCLADWHALSAATGDPAFAWRADDHLAFAGQLMAVVDGEWNSQRGLCTEQFYVSDWSIWDRWDPGPDHVQKGTFMGFGHVWCTNHLLLALEERERAGLPLG